MDLVRLFKLQRALDVYMAKEYNGEPKQMLTKKTLLLLCNVGEVSNELGKWPTYRLERVLKKYIEGLQLILSLGIDLGIDRNFLFYNCKLHNENLTELLFIIYEKTIILHNQPIIINYIELITVYIHFGLMFDPDKKEIEKAYLDNYLKHMKL
ncbi:dUTP diphosphatase [Bacillus cereus]|uniref:dUTP diphosphatase n=1 Tax=Bacillus cereus TaxID=1396 RepID=UPI000279D8DE|nr:dUTP diphosphatase [Bacillus cereus]EJR93126.1 hypothetical protein IKG_05580 [Bacillus cereus VD200]